MSLKDRKGLITGTITEDVTQERVAGFCALVGAPLDDPPMTLPTCFRRTEEQLLRQLGLNLSMVLHGEQEYLYERPWTVGMRVECQSTLANVLEKTTRQALMQFLLFETTYTDADSRSRLGVSRTTIIVKTMLEGEA